MKKRKSKKYLVIGNVALGWDLDILNVFAQVANFHGCEVIHTGDLTTSEEKKMYERRINRIRTWEKKLELELDRRARINQKKAKKLGEEIDKLEQQALYAETEAKENKYENAIQKREERISFLDYKLEEYEEKSLSRIQTAKEEAQELINMQFMRMETLKDVFGKVKYVANREQFLKDSSKIVGKYLNLGSHLVVQSVNANGAKVSHQPITDRAFKYLKKLKKSAITPHPIPALRSFEREGENQAWNFYTTGALKDSDDSLRPSEFHKASNLPSALFVAIDVENGEFHTSRLHIDEIPDPGSKKLVKAVLWDKRAYTTTDVWDLDNGDIAVGLTDSHAPYHCPRSLASVIFLSHISEAETLVHGGDLNDWIGVCPHNKHNPKERENKRLLDDIKAFAWYTKEISQSPHIKRKILVDSNHENWVIRYTNDHPELIGIVDQNTIFKELIPDWEFHIPTNGADFTRWFGDIALRHGDKESLNKAVKLFTKYWQGHFHSHQEILRCGSSGASCLLSPGYLGGNLTGWQDCVTTFTKYENIASFDIKSVLGENGKARISWQGEIYEFPEHKPYKP